MLSFNLAGLMKDNPKSMLEINIYFNLTVLERFLSPLNIAIVVAQSNIVAKAPPCTDPFIFIMSFSILYLNTTVL